MVAKMVAVNRGSSILSLLVLVHVIQVTVQEEFIVVGGNVGALGGRARKGPNVSGTLASIDQKIAARNPGYFSHSPNRKRYADGMEFALRPGQNMRRKLKRSPVGVGVGIPRRGRRTRFPRAPRHPYHPRPNINRHRNPRSSRVVAKRYKDDSVIVVDDSEEDRRRPRSKKYRHSSLKRYPGSNDWGHGSNGHEYEDKNPKKMILKVRSVPSERPAYSVANTVIGGKPAGPSSSEEQQSQQSSYPPYNQGQLDGYMKQLMKLSQVMLSSSRDLVNGGGFPSPQSSADPSESSSNPKDNSGEVSGPESAQGKASEFQTSGSNSGSAISNGGFSGLGSGYQSWEAYEPGKTILYGPNLGFNFAGSDDGLSSSDYGYGGDKKNSVSSPNLHFYFFAHKDPNFGGLPNNFYAESAGSGSELPNTESPEADKKKSSGEEEQNNPNGGEGPMSELPTGTQQGGSFGSMLPAEKSGGSGEQGNGPQNSQDFGFGSGQNFGGKGKRSRVHRQAEEVIDAELEVPMMEKFTPEDAVGQGLEIGE